MGVLIVFCPLTTTAGVDTVVQTGERRLVVVWRIVLLTLVGHVRTRFFWDAENISCGDTGASEMLNTVPFPKLPPFLVVPYSTLPDKANPPLG